MGSTSSQHTGGSKTEPESNVASRESPEEISEGVLTFPEPQLDFHFDSPQTALEIQEQILKLLSFLTPLVNLIPVPPVRIAGLVISIPICSAITGILNLLSNEEEIAKALMKAEIDKSCAELAVSSLNAKIESIKQRLSNVWNPQVAVETKKIEIICAVDKCDEILHLFKEKNYPFRKSVVASIPYLFAFLSLSKSVLIHASTLHPTAYAWTNFEQRMNQMKELIDIYIEEFRAARFNSNVIKYHLSFLELTVNIFLLAHGLRMGDSSRIQDTMNTSKEFWRVRDMNKNWYEGELWRIYEEYFEQFKKNFGY